MHDQIIIHKLDSLIQVLIICVNIAIPKFKVNGKKGIPGWNQFVRQYKEESIFWNDAWISAGKPQTGQFADRRKFSKYKYHWAIKQVKRNKDKILLESTAQQIESKSFKDFWSNINKKKGNNCI